MASRANYVEDFLNERLRILGLRLALLEQLASLALDTAALVQTRIAALEVLIGNLAKSAALGPNDADLIAALMAQNVSPTPSRYRMQELQRLLQSTAGCIEPPSTTK